MSLYLKENREPATGDTEWVVVLKAFPASNEVLNHLKYSEDGKKILDGFSNPIVYIPANTPPTNLPNGHFKSFGGDGDTGFKNNRDFGADDLFSQGTAP